MSRVLVRVELWLHNFDNRGYLSSSFAAIRRIKYEQFERKLVILLLIRNRKIAAESIVAEKN